MRVLVAGAGRGVFDGDSIDHGAPIVFSIDDVLTVDECAALVARIDATGPELAPITTSAGEQTMEDVRNNERVMFDDPALAADLFRRVEAHLPPSIFDMRPVGANERFRGYRYRPGQQFRAHFDGSFERGNGEQSQLTFMIYLNDDFEGGETAFLDYEVAAVPRTGSALLFQHLVLHEGCRVISGTKYVLRSDVMYQRTVHVDGGT